MSNVKSTPVPELRLYKIIDLLVDEVNRDYHSHARKEETMLYNLFGGDSELGKYNYFNEAVDLFTNRDEGHPRKLKVRMMYDAAEASVPTIHLTTPSEIPSTNTLSVGESGGNWVESDVDGTITPKYNRRFQATYHIVCTSENAREVFLMYHVIRAAMISALDYIDLAGLKNPSLGGQEIRQQDHMAPNHIYMRALTLSCLYEVEIPRYFDHRKIANIVLDNPIPIENN